MEETNRKRQLGGSECGFEAVESKTSSKKPRTPASCEVTEENAAVDQEREDMVAWLSLDPDTVAELSDLLDSSGTATPSPGQPVKFVDDPYSSLVIFKSSSAYVTINGNEESCGSSFSELDSSVMASIDMGSVRGLVRKLSGKLYVNGGGSEEEEGLRGWLEERDFVEGIFAKSLSGCDLFGTPPPSRYNYENDGGSGSGGGGGGGGGELEDEMWMEFVGEDLFGGAW